MEKAFVDGSSFGIDFLLSDEGLSW